MDTQRLLAAIPAEADGWCVALDEMILHEDEAVFGLADELAALLTTLDDGERITPEDARACGFRWADLETLFEAGILAVLDDADARWKVRFAPLDDVRLAMVTA